MDIGEIIWIFVVMYFLYRLFFAPSKPRQQDRYDVPSEPSYEEDESTRTRDDILDEMRTIFGEESTTEKPEPEPSPRSRPSEQPANRDRSPAPGESKYSSYTGTNFIDTRGEKSEADIALEDVTFESRALMEQRKSKRHSLQYLFEYEELRKGIIISEILSKPKSQRRQNI